MAITLAQTPATNNSGGTTLLTVTPGAGFTNGNGLIVAVGSVSRAPTSVTDTNAVALTLVQTANFFGSPFATLWWLAAASGSPTTIKVNFASSTTCVAVAYEVNGTISTDAGNAASANTTTASAGAITTTAANTIAVACLQDGVSITQPAGYTLDGNAQSGAAASLVYTSVQTGINPTWANTSGGTAAVIQAFASTNTGAPARAMPPRTFGALLPFGPWAFGLPTVPSPYFVPAPPPPHADVPAVTAGLPLYPLPIRLALFKQLPIAPPPYRPAPPPPPPVPPPGPGRGKRSPFVRRQTSFDDDARRLRRTLDQYSVMFNSLIAQGVVRETSLGKWQIVGGSHVAAVDPTAADDTLQGFVPGSMWLNSATRTGFMCVDNTAAAAVWKQVT